MEKIDRLGWVAGFCFTSHGARIGIRVNDPDVLEQLAAFLPPGSVAVDRPIVDWLYSLLVAPRAEHSRIRRFNMLYSGSAPVGRSLVLSEVLEAFASDVHFQVALGARRELFVHAGAVGWRGGAIVLPGRSRSGKSMLVDALVRAGATYYSDEYAAIDAWGRIHAYPKPISLRRDAGAPRRTIPAKPNGRTGARPLPVRMIAVCQYRAGTRWHPRSLSPAEALLSLLSNTVVVRRRPAFALARLQRTVGSAVALKGARGEACDVAAALLSASHSP